jgi:FkbM family methyltransferase
MLRWIERGACYAQGKGYGSATIAQEVSAVNSLMRGDPKLMVDIGGNKGDYSAELRSRFKECQIHIFEPSTFNLERLSKRFIGDKLIAINPHAVSEMSGKSVLFSDRPGSGLGSVNKRRLDHFGIEFTNCENINTIRFEEYWCNVLLKSEIDLVKIDIEGHELSALNGFGEALRFVQMFQFEFGGANIDSRTYFQDLYYFFCNNDFKIYRISPFGLVPVALYTEWDETFVTTNYIAVNSSLGKNDD